MLKRIYTKFITLNPFLKVVATILTIFGVVGSGYIIKDVSFFQTVINHNYPEKEKTIETKKEDVKKEKISIQTANTEKKSPVKAKSLSNKTNNTINDTKSTSIFSKYPLKKSSNKTISFFVIKNGKIDSKTTRAISSTLKNIKLNTPLLFNSNALAHFNDFMSPSNNFLETQEANNYLDYYFICEITLLDTEKISGMDTYTSSLNIEGYLINTKTIDTKTFPYRNIKGAGYTLNDANQNVAQDLEGKIVDFIKDNI